MRPTYNAIVEWMREYFAAYNAYAQNPETVHKMSDFFTEDVQFIPYISDFGGPENAVTSRDDFFRMFTGHPTVYEQFELDDIVVDEKRMVAVSLLDVKLFDSKTDEVLVNKHYLPRYQLVLDDEGIARRGLIVRHLVLPDGMAGSRESLTWLAEEVSPEVTVSIMSQYYPAHRASRVASLSRTLQISEYSEVIEVVNDLGLENGWIQEMEAADYYQPDFERDGHPFVSPGKI